MSIIRKKRIQNSGAGSQNKILPLFFLDSEFRLLYSYLTSSSGKNLVVRSRPNPANEKEEEMPVIHVHMFEGRTLDQKRKLVAAMTEAVVKSLDSKPETVQILIHENPKTNVAAAGVLHSDKK
jgi:4-oxalocrotonate tautomerase